MNTTTAPGFDWPDRSADDGRGVMTALRHGLYATYINRACRCDACRAAMNAYAKSRKAQRRVYLILVAGVQVTTAAVAHGRISTYINWMCRCGDCSAAWSEYGAAYRRSSKAVAS